MSSVDSVQGTANQVLANGTAGTPQTGAVVLTLPQSVDTGASVQFGKLGVGTAAPTNTGSVRVAHVQAASSGQACVVVAGSLTPGSGTDLHPNAFRDITAFTANASGDAYASYDCNATLSGSVPCNHFNGYQARQSYQGTNTLGVLAGFKSELGVSAGAVTEARGFYVADPTVSGGSVGHYAGLYVDQLTQGTTRHAIYVAGNNNVFMAGGQLAISELLTPINPYSRLDVTFDQYDEYGICVKNTHSAASGYMLQFYNASNVQQGSIQQANSTTVSFNTTSDQRMKENVRDLVDSGAIIDALQPRVFDWKWGGKNFHGFIAQELHPVYPEAVSVGGDTQPWAVDYSKLVPVLAAEIKSLRARVSQLEAARA